jgi:ribonuclease J
MTHADAKQPQSLHIAPLGGVGEIGMNMMLFRYGEDYLIVDSGIRFPDTTMTGVEVILPNLSILAAIQDKIRAIILTHGHEDHIGAIRLMAQRLDLRKTPILGTAFTLALLRRRLAEEGLAAEMNLEQIRPGDTADLNPFKATFIRVTHSIPDCVAVCLETPIGRVIHTGDFKIDRNPLDGERFDEDSLRALGDEGIDLLLSDSTNASVPGWTRSEEEVAIGLEEQIAPWKGRVIVSLFSSNLYRIHSLFKIAQRNNRILCLLGRSVHQYVEVGRQTIGLELPKETDLVDVKQLHHVPRHQQLLVCTGSQAEPRSVLARASRGEHRNLSFSEDDLVLMSCRKIPGNERRIHRMINDILRAGATCVFGKQAPIHASGHARQDELKRMLELTRPKCFIPVHGEYSFLVDHANLAKEVGVEQIKIIEDGSVISLSPQGITEIAQEQVEPFFHDGNNLGTSEELCLAEKKRLAWNGVAVVDVTIDPTRGLFLGLNVETRGLFNDEGRLCKEIEDAVGAQMSGQISDMDTEELKRYAAMLVRREFRNRTRRKPVTLVQVQAGK